MRSAHPFRDFGSMPGGRWLFAVAVAHTLIEDAAWVAILIVAFEDGGAAESGRAVAIQLLPAAVAAPFVAAAGDRYPRHRVIAVALVVITASTVGIAVALLADSSLDTVYLLGALLCITLVATPTAIASLMVHHARSPEQLTALNALTSIVRWAGILLGPLTAAAALAVLDPAYLFVGLAVLSALALLVVAVGVQPDDRPSASLRLRDIGRDSLAGIRYSASTLTVRNVLVFLIIGHLLAGALDVIVLSVAFDQLDRGASTAALLSACLAAGAVIASIASTRLVGRAPLWLLATIGGLVMALPIAVLGRATVALVAVFAVAVVGCGTAVFEIGGLTLLQRVGAETMTSRVFGVFNSCALAAVSVGALGVGWSIDELGAPTSMAGLAAVGSLGIVAGGRVLRRVENDVPVIDPDLIEELRRVPFFATLPLPTIERLIQQSVRRALPAGTPVIVQGEPGSHFFVLVAGRVRLDVDGAELRVAACPDYFGEIALVRDCVRTATVTTSEPSVVVSIERGDFLEAISLTASSQLAAASVADRRLAGTTTRERPPDTGTLSNDG